MSEFANTGVFPVISTNPRVQAHYEACRREGTSHSLAEMFALRQPPMSNTDREFLEGHCNGNQFEKTPEIGEAYKRVARAHGQNPAGKVYLSGLARFPGDPEAWVSGKGDVENILDRRGWGAEGAVHREIKNVAEPEQIAVAPDIVDREVEEILETVPPEDRPRVDVEDLREQVIEKRKPHWAD